MNMARYEQETIINFNEEEKTAGIYTHNKMLRQKLAALARDGRRTAGSSKRPAADGQLTTPFQNHG